MSVAWAQREGAVVDGQFPLGAFLGGTERSAVFHTQAGNHNAAIKLIPADSQDAEIQIARWKLAVHLSHPHLLRMFRTGRCQVGGTPMLYAVMDLAEENLGEILPERALTIEEVSEMIEPVLDALTYLHSQKFAHGRLKPSNIMASGEKLKLSSDGLLPLGEFARHHEKPDPHDPPEKGTRGNMAAGDIWSLGMTLVETLTRHLPARDVKGETDPIIPPDMPEPFREIAHRALHLDPTARCTVADIRAMLRPAVAPAAKVSKSAAVATAAKLAKKPVATAAGPAGRDSPSAPAIAAAHPEFQAVAPTAPSPAATPPDAAKKQAADKRRYIVSAAVAVIILLAIFVGPRLLGPRDTNAPAPNSASDVAMPAPAPRSAEKLGSTPAKISPHAAKQPPLDAVTPNRVTPLPARPPEAKPKATASGPADAQVLNQVIPEVSEKARGTIQGKVRVRVKVSVDSAGAVTSAGLSSPSPSRFFADRAIEAARQWKFAPGTAAGDWILQFDFRRSETEVVPLHLSQ